jgi:hypothetical protein
MRRSGSMAALVLLLGLSGAAAQNPPEAADYLFDHPQWAAAAPGTTISYRYRRTTALQDIFGPNIEDSVRLTLDPGASPESRTVRVALFSGERRRPAGPFEDVSGNPALILFLEHHVETLARVLKGNPRYLKNAIRAGLRDKATVVPTTVEADGQSLKAWRIETKPFIEDHNREKLRGLETLTYTFIATDPVPGSIASIEANAVGEDGTLLYSETLTHDRTER